MKKISSLIALFVLTSYAFSQDTFSIVAVDSVTGEVGAAGASCVDLDASGIANDDFIAQLFPVEKGAITTQASYNSTNQANAKFRMFEGYTPSGILSWLYANDVGSNPEARQYGIVAMVSGSPESASFTGTSTSDYKNHIEGPNYAIQGNILLGQEILDSMEARFLAEEGDLACKLMAALQGANVVGADTRCMTNGTSSLFGFLKVAQPTDAFGSPSYLISVRTADGEGIEPIDSLQVLFDASHECGVAGSKEVSNELQMKMFPNPAIDILTIQTAKSGANALSIRTPSGILIDQFHFESSCSVDISEWPNGLYICTVSSPEGITVKRFVKN